MIFIESNSGLSEEKKKISAPILGFCHWGGGGGRSNPFANKTCSVARLPSCPAQMCTMVTSRCVANDVLENDGLHAVTLSNEMQSVSG